MTHIRKAIRECLPLLVLTDLAITISVYLLGIVTLSANMLSFSVLVLFIVSLFTLAAVLIAFNRIAVARFVGLSLASLWTYQLLAWVFAKMELTTPGLVNLVTQTFYLTLILCCIDFIVLLFAVDWYRHRIVDLFVGIFEAVFSKCIFV